VLSEEICTSSRAMVLGFAMGVGRECLCAVRYVRISTNVRCELSHHAPQPVLDNSSGSSSRRPPQQTPKCLHQQQQQ